MGTYYVNPDSGSDSNDGSQSRPWKNWTYGLAGNRVTGGDTIVLAPGVYTTYHGTATRGITNVGGTGGDVTVVGENAEIQLPANLTETAIVGAGGGPRLVLDGMAFTNPHNTNVKLGEGTVADARLLFRNCTVDMGIERITFNANKGLVESEGCHILNTRALVFGRVDGGDVQIRNAIIDKLHFIFTSSKQLNFTMSDSEVRSGTYDKLLIYTSSALMHGAFSRNRIHLSDVLASPLYFYNNLISSIEAGVFLVDGNTFYRNLSGLDDATRRTIYHNISSYETGCDFVPGRNYFVEFDSDVATAIYSGSPIPSRKGEEIVALGDSIVADGRWRGAFAAAAGQVGVVDQSSAFGGARLDAIYWLIDDLMRSHTPKYVLIQGGINDFYSGVKSPEFIAQAVNMVVSICKKIQSYGVEPIWLGCPPRNASDNDDIIAFNSQAGQVLNAMGVKNMSIYDALTTNPSWTTDYYDSIATDVHPNASGQAAIGRAWGEFFRQVTASAQAAEVLPTQPGGFSLWSSLSAALPALAFVGGAPARLKEVQVWGKLVEKKEIDEVRQ